ncbi:MAG TPA: exodeoxyribonuclease VII large subunit [Chloroflexota bacterium]|nr:exodeoxyribonuclease VII large subunit [Chloroflexota bacterium]
MVIWDVAQVNRYVKQLIEADERLADLWVEGEVSNFVVSMSGHAFFTLKEAQSQLRCVMFRQQLARVRQRPENGDKCVARGALRVYEAQGAYQLYVEFVAPSGLGELQLRLEELMARLGGEGLFDDSRKRPLPAWPRRIGVVTSATGAVLHDIRTVVARRWPVAELVLAATAVQGEVAAAQICRAIEDLNDFGRVDVIVVARGGGSLEDLWPFNDEAVARAIFASRVPVVSAIGHETDVTIADLVADRRAATPSAAAELIVPDIDEVRQRLAEYARIFWWQGRRHLDRHRSDLRDRETALERFSPIEIVVRYRSDLVSLSRRAGLAVVHDLALRRERLTARELQLDALSPLAILDRGYSVTWLEESGEVVRHVGQVDTGSRLRTRVTDGIVTGVVESSERTLA